MCGIVGYIGHNNVVPILMSGLTRLEYRGYDSAGIAVYSDGEVVIRKAKGRIKNLEDRVREQPVYGTMGIGHTRWATHGEPSDVNSHPQTDMKGDIAVIHNGIIENYLKLKEFLIEQGCVFVSETDTEVIAHLLNHYYHGNMLDTIYQVLPMLKGSFALGIVCKSSPGELYCTRKDSPLVVGKADHGSFMASDIPAILEYARDVYLLDDLDVAVLRRSSISIYNSLKVPLQKDILHVDWDVKVAEKAGFEHFMLKEIHDEPNSLRDTLMPHVDTDGSLLKFRAESMPLDSSIAKEIKRVHILACGTAYHAGLVGRYAIEKLAGIPVEVEIASEFRYRDAIVDQNTLAIIISQSGETADSIAALREARRKGAKVLAICNVVGSTISREADAVLYTWAGLEIAVASTKAYVCQLMMLYLIAIDIANKRGVMDDEAVADNLSQLLALPEKVKSIIVNKENIQKFAHSHYDRKSVFFIGRGLDYALAQEGSLKLKEVSYVHSEAYAAGELKHGTIALIEEGTLVVAISTQDALVDKTISNIKEVKVRGAKVLAIADAIADGLEKECDDVWNLPDVKDIYSPILAIVPMQLFAYYMSIEKGCDVDKPRNLAKSVTVE